MDQDRKSASGVHSTQSRYILIVDRDLNNVFHTSILLSRFDFLIEMATSSSEAVDIIKTAQPALMIVAQYLRDMTGPEFIESLRKNNLAVDVPFLGLSIPGDLLGEHRFRALGASDCLFEPVLPDQLNRVIQKTLEIDARRDVRIRTFLPVKINDHLLECPDSVCAIDISELGMFVRTANPYEVATRLSIEIDLQGLKLGLQAVVVHSFKTQKGPYHEAGMGLEFLEISPQDKSILRQFINNEVTRY